MKSAPSSVRAEVSKPASGERYRTLEFEYRPSPDQRAAEPARHPVIVVGAGPVGLSLAIDLAQRGVRTLVLDNDHKLSTGSRAICFAKRTLEIFDRLGCGDPMVAKGVSWSRGRVYFGSEAVYGFDLLPETGHERPAFINLQQYYVEGMLADRAAELPNLEIRWCNTVSGIEQSDQSDDTVLLRIDTPDGPYTLRADHVAACDGSRSALRSLLGLETQGRVFRDRFLIADVQMHAPGFPAERRFWFDPPFHPGQSVLLHKQADDMWRVDFQLGWDADPAEERKPERIAPRVQALLDSIGAGATAFTIGWASVYTFACMRMASFRHGRVLFAGDSAHGVSPFGARGANSGVQDAENLAWKLAATVRREVDTAAANALLDSYAHEREHAADENILNSTRSTDFITPKSNVSCLFRDAVLDLSREFAFARRLVNSGRLSVPATLDGSPLNTADVGGDSFDTPLRPGAAAADAPLLHRGDERRWLLRVCGSGFTLLVFGVAPAWAAHLPLSTLAIDGEALVDVDGLAAARYAAQPGTAYLIRPDLHVCARWRAPSEAAVRNAIERACGRIRG